MALNIEFEGYVNEVKEFGWGNVAKMSHNRRKKNESTGEWETVSKDYLDVVLPEGRTTTEGSLLKVGGTFTVETFAKRDGSTGIAIKVRAEYVQPVERGSRPSSVTKPEDMPF